MNENEIYASRLANAIRKMASHDDALNNFESYLSYHFAEWLEKYANTPAGLVGEFESFANMYDE